MSEYFIEYGDNLRVVPAIHHRIVFSQLVTRGLANGWRPNVIALELPASIKDAVIYGLDHKSSGPLWVGKRVQETWGVTPISALTGFQHTREALEATVVLLLQARLHALTKLKIQPECDGGRWVSMPDEGFEPFIIITGNTNTKPTCLSNVVLPERRFHASVAYGEEVHMNGKDIRSATLGGRTWFTPPYHSGDHWKRSEWVKKGNQKYVPGVQDTLEINPGKSWRKHLILHALLFCRKHVLYIAPSSLPPPYDLILYANSKGIQIVHVPTHILDENALSIVARDEHEWAPTIYPEMRDPAMEIFSLHSGDAFIAALRYAIENTVETAWIDNELIEPSELVMVNNRPLIKNKGEEVHFIEDSLLLDEGIQAFYNRTRQLVEMIRVPDVDERREKHMAANLKELMARGKQILFVCGAAHWGKIKDYLDDPQFAYNKVTGGDEPGTLFCSGKYSLLGGGDEIPVIIMAYDELRLKKREMDFSHLQASEDIDQRIRECQLRCGGGSISNHLKVKVFMDRLCKLSGVIVPRIYHLVATAQSFFGGPGRRTVYQECMKFFSCPKGIPKLESAQFKNNNIQAVLDGKTFNLLSRQGGLNYIYDRENCEIKEKNDSVRQGGDGSCDLRYATGGWEIHMKEMNLSARRYARPKLASKETLQVTNLLYGSIDSRATARARTRGEIKLYQKVHTRSILNTLNEFEGFDPIVWVFEEDFSRAVENLVLDRTAPDLVIGLAVTPRLSRGGLAYQCNFELLATWVPRFSDTDPAMMRRIKRWIAQGNEQYIPKFKDFADTFRDSGLSGNSKIEKSLLLALNFCREYVICVSEREPSRRVRDAFRDKRKYLLHVPLSHFEAAEIEYLRTPIFGDHFTSCL